MARSNNGTFIGDPRRDSKNTLSSDLSYIFVHVYEILNLVETPDPIQAAERIRILWLAYREKYPNLDRYLPIGEAIFWL